MLKNLIVIAGITFLVSAACAKIQTETNAANNSTVVNSGDTAASNAAQTAVETKKSDNPNAKTFLGFIDDKRVQIDLVRDGGKLSGTYSYERIGEKLNLDGTIDAAGNFTLQETDKTGGKTGEWKGKWKTDDGRVTLTGNWKSPKGKSLTFSADEQITDFKGDVKIVTKSSREDNKPKGYKINSEFPELEGVDKATADNFNAIVKKIVADSNKQFKESIADLTAGDIKSLADNGAGLYEELTYNVLLANDDVVSIQFEDSDYSGGAHGSSGSIPLNFDLKNNRELKLADIFEPNANYLKTLSDYSIQNIKAHLKDTGDDETIKDGAGAKEENFKSWNLTKKGLRITFDAYQVASYAEGPQTVDIPYAKLQTILRKDGAAAKLAK